MSTAFEIILGIIGLIFVIWLFIKIIGFVFNNIGTIIFIVIIIILIFCISRCLGCSSENSAQKEDIKMLKAMIAENKKLIEDRHTVLSFPSIVKLVNKGEYKTALKELEKYKRVKNADGEDLSYSELYYVAEVLYNIDEGYQQAHPLLVECIKNRNSVEDKIVMEKLTQYINNSCKNEICGQWIAVEEKSKSYPSRLIFYSDGTGLIGDNLVFNWKSYLTEPNKYKVSISAKKNTYYNFYFDIEKHEMTIWQSEFAYSKK